MAKTNYPEELVSLVQEYLTDGVITAKERQVLTKKAVALGIDADEFDLYLDAQQQKADQEVDAAASKKRGKTCPFCGGTVPQLADKCPHCGETITAEASEELQEIFDNLEEALVDFKSGKDIAKSKATVERYVRKAKMYYENNPKVQKLLAEIQEESIKAAQSAKSNARKDAIINILTYNKKYTVIAGIVVVGILCVIIVSIKRVIFPDLTMDAQACIEAVNEALKEGDIAKAEAIYGGWSSNVENNGGTWSVRAAKEAIENAKEAIENAKKSNEENVVEKFNGLLNENKTTEAKNLFLSTITSQDDVSSKDDVMCLSLVNAYISKGDYDAAEEVGLALKSKMDDYGWYKTSTYSSLKEKFNAKGRDFSTLYSRYDY